MTSKLSRSAVSAATAVLLSMGIASQSLAASWRPPVRVAASAWASSIAASDESTAVAAYERCVGGDFCYNRSYVRRTTNGGATWGSRPVWSVDGDYAVLAARGRKVDLVWRDGRLGEPRYARSIDGGASFGRAVHLSSTTFRASPPSVARGPAGVVVVAWLEQSTLEVSVRVSRDGGKSFGRLIQWAEGDGAAVGVAVGSGVIYVGYQGSSGGLVVRRSLDGGSNWSKPKAIAPQFGGSFVITSEAEDAYVGYTSGSSRGQVHYHATSNRGRTWTAPRLLSPEEWSSDHLDISLADGVLHAVFWRVRANGGRWFYRSSADGTSWTIPQPVLPRNACAGFGSHLAVATKVFVLCDDVIDVYAAVGSP